MKVKEIIDRLRTFAPEEYALEWDNSGLLLGRAAKEVKRILIAVDADDETVKEALRTETDLLISHHPLIFSAIKKMTDEEFIGARLLKLAANDTAYYAMHTNYDVCRMGKLAAERLGLKETEPLEETGEYLGEAAGIGRIGWLGQEMPLSGFAALVKERFGTEGIRCFGWEKPVRRIAVCPGAGSSVIKAALARKADVLLTGDIGHHSGIDAKAQGLSVLDAGHYGLEHIFMEDVRDFLRETLEDEAEISVMPKRLPFTVI